ncbi:MAG: hypothetical protein RIT43_1837 [Bacteroidota bacterium]
MFVDVDFLEVELFLRKYLLYLHPLSTTSGEVAQLVRA